MKQRILQYTTGLTFVLLVWQIGAGLIDNRMIPSALETLSFSVQNASLMLTHTAASALRMISAMIISLFIGVSLGIFMGRNRLARKFLDPFFYFLYPLPKVAFLPVFMVFFGLGNFSKILMITLIVVFQLVISVRDAVIDIDQNLFLVLSGLTTSRLMKLRFVIFPAALPRILSGLRIAVGISLASLFFAENYATQWGLGYLTLSAWTKLDYVQMFAGILFLGILGVLFYVLLDGLEEMLTPWREEGK